MFDFLDNYDYLILPYLGHIMRGILIPFMTLGIVYIFGKLLEITKTDKSRNILATVVLVLLSFFTGKFDGHYINMFNFKYIFESLVYVAIGSIIYVNFCWKLFSRIDDLLDRKVGKDADEIIKLKLSEEKRKTASAMRKAKKEEKELVIANKKLESTKKRLAKKKKKT